MLLNLDPIDAVVYGVQEARRAGTDPAREVVCELALDQVDTDSWRDGLFEAMRTAYDAGPDPFDAGAVA